MLSRVSTCLSVGLRPAPICARSESMKVRSQSVMRDSRASQSSSKSVYGSAQPLSPILPSYCHRLVFGDANLENAAFLPILSRDLKCSFSCNAGKYRVPVAYITLDHPHVRLNAVPRLAARLHLACPIISWSAQYSGLK